MFERTPQEVARTVQTFNLTVAVMPVVHLGRADILAQMMFGSAEVHYTPQRALADAFLDGCLGKPESERLDPAIATARVHSLDFTGWQTAGILMDTLTPRRCQTTMRRLDVTKKEIQTAVIQGMAVLLTPQQICLLNIATAAILLGIAHKPPLKLED